MEQTAEMDQVWLSAGSATWETRRALPKILTIPINADRKGRHPAPHILGLLICVLAASDPVQAWSGEVIGQRGGSDLAMTSTGDDLEIKAVCDEVVKAHNRIRADAKLPALTISSKLEAAAGRHAKDMASRKKMAHKGGDGSTPLERIKAAGYPYRRAGENVAVGRFTVEKLMKGWMDSPHHKQNILGSFSQIGVACAIG